MNPEQKEEEILSMSPGETIIVNTVIAPIGKWKEYSAIKNNKL